MLNKNFVKKLSVSCMSAVLAVSCATGMIPMSYAETNDGSITVTYYKGKGKFTTDKDTMTVTIKDGKVIDGNYEIPTRDYWNFRYWQNNGKKYNVSADGVPEGVTEDLALAPSWETQMRYFDYKTNGGSFADGTTRHSMIYKANIVSEDGFKYEEPTREGYTFKGWFTDKECTDGKEVKIDASGRPEKLLSYEADKKVTLYACWVDAEGKKADPAAEDTSVTVTFDANGGEGGFSIDAQKGAGLTAGVNSVSRTGYTFKGWSETKTGDVKYKSGDTIMVDKATTFYAVWEKSEPEDTELSVRFDANGGEGSMESEVFVNGESKALTANAFTKDGFKFAGWALSATGEVAYKDGEVMNPSKDAKSMTLYAIWEKESEDTSYTIKFDANGGDGEMPDQSFQKDQSGALDKNTFVNPGYLFKGWAVTKNGSVVYTDAMNVVMEKDMTLYAVWSKKSENPDNVYTVKFDANGGEGAMSDMVFKKNITQKLGKNKFTREGYTFKGWSIKAGGEVAFDDEAAVTVSSDRTLYAVWSKDAVVTYTVKFEQTDAKGSMKDQVFTAGKAQKLTKNAYTKDGYTFAGWSENKNGLVRYKDEEEVAMKTNTTLYPIFTETKYTVKFDANGGSGSMKDQIFTYDQEQSLSANAFTRDGYEFAGWAEKKDASTATYSDKASRKVTKDMTLYAVWKPATLTIIYKANGGSGTMDNQTFTSGEKVTLKSNKFTRDGYTFKGWAYRENATEIALEDGETKNDWKTGAILWAVWEKSYSDITVYANDNTNKNYTIAAATLVKNNGKLPKAAEVMAAQDGYVFKEWNTKVDGTGTSYKDEAEIKADGQPTVLFGIWEKTADAATDGKDTGAGTTASGTTTSIGGNILTGDVAKTGLLLSGALAAIAAIVAILVKRRKSEH